MRIRGDVTRCTFVLVDWPVSPEVCVLPSPYGYRVVPYIFASGYGLRILRSSQDIVLVIHDTTSRSTVRSAKLNYHFKIWGQGGWRCRQSRIIAACPDCVPARGLHCCSPVFAFGGALEVASRPSFRHMFSAKR